MIIGCHGLKPKHPSDIRFTEHSGNIFAYHYTLSNQQYSNIIYPESNLLFQMKDFIIDIHCHSQLKAYAHSFDKSGPTYKNSTNPNHKNSSWWSDWPDPTDIRMQVDGLFGLTKFSQADYRKCLDGNLGIVFSSLYPIERGFVKSRLGSGPTIDKIINHITEFGEPRINFAQKLKDYFPDLENEYYWSSTPLKEQMP